MKKLLIAFIAGTASSSYAQSCNQVSYIVPSFVDITFDTEGTISNFNSLAFASAVTTSMGPESCFCNQVDIELDVDPTHAEANTLVCSGGPQTFLGRARADISHTSNSIRFFIGVILAADIKIDCYPCLTGLTMQLSSGGAGVFFDYDTTQDIDVTPPNTLGPNIMGTPTRQVIAYMLCSAGQPPVYTAAYSNANTFIEFSSGPATWGAGSISTSSVMLTIDDNLHDLNSDGRFNQLDVDILFSLIGTMAATDPAYQLFDIVNDPNSTSDDGVDADDADIFQCFVDACLDARIIGDSDCDNDLDCDDLTAVLAQPFNGELFTGSVYKIGFDVDLDGDNDAADKLAIREKMLEVEPANFILDGSLDFFDTSEFLSLYGSGDPLADINGDGSFDFFDISDFLTAYGNPICF